MVSWLPGRSAKRASDISAYATLLRPYIARHTSPHDVEDVLQETMLRIHQRRNEEGIDSFSAYAFQTARSVMADRARRDFVRKGRAHTELDEAHHPIELVTPERILAGKETLKRFTTALEDMPERTRHVFILHRFEDMSYADIADHIGVSHSAVGKHMVKALRFLAQRDLP